MKLEKREVTLNEKDTLSDMLFFERGLAIAYREAADVVETKEARALLVEHEAGLADVMGRLEEMLQKKPKM